MDANFGGGAQSERAAESRKQQQQQKNQEMKHIVFDIETIPQDEARLLALRRSSPRRPT